MLSIIHFWNKTTKFKNTPSFHFLSVTFVKFEIQDPFIICSCTVVRIYCIIISFEVKVLNNTYCIQTQAYRNMSIRENMSRDMKKTDFGISEQI